VQSRGIVIESENGIINATMEEQFKSLDKLFEDVLAKS
jgi:flagellar assembly protein FliH